MHLYLKLNTVLKYIADESKHIYVYTSIFYIYTRICTFIYMHICIYIHIYLYLYLYLRLNTIFGNILD
jgi:hypothetical protein